MVEAIAVVVVTVLYFVLGWFVSGKDKEAMVHWAIWYLFGLLAVSVSW